MESILIFLLNQSTKDTKKVTDFIRPVNKEYIWKFLSSPEENIMGRGYTNRESFENDLKLLKERGLIREASSQEIELSPQGVKTAMEIAIMRKK